jgi:hypothetical protein
MSMVAEQNRPRPRCTAITRVTGEQCRRHAQPDSDRCFKHDGRPIPRQCSAHSKQTGARCGNSAEPGLSVCRFHGSRSPRAQAKKLERATEAKALVLLENLSDDDHQPVVNPVVELSKLAAEVLYFKDVFRDEVAKLQTLETYDATGAEEVRAIIRLYERAVDRSQRLLVEMSRLDLDARLVRLDELQADLMFTAVIAVLNELGLDREQVSKARELLGAKLRALT